MRLQQSISLTLATISLSGCMPFVGHNSGNDKSTCVGLAVLPFAFIQQDMIGNCHHDLPQPKEPADDTTKHVQLTEPQRLQLAQEAARAFYPWETNKFRVAQNISQELVRRQYPDRSGVDLNCNEMITVRDFAASLQHTLPQDYFYTAIAENWSQLYSDEQILKISTAAKNGPITNPLSLSPQPDILPNAATSIPYPAEKKYADLNEAVFAPQITHTHEVIVSQRRTLTQTSSQGNQTASCSVERTDASTGYYEFKENIFKDGKLEQRRLPVMSPVQ